MKKILAMLLAVMLMAGLVACSNETAPATTTTATTGATEEATEPAQDTTGATEPAQDTTGATEEATEPAEDTTGAVETTPAVEMTASMEILSNIWGKYADNEKFMCFGGSADAMVDGAPGRFNIADTDGLTFTLLVPADQIANLADAASLVHGMLTNNFTCGVFELVEGADAAAFTEAMKTSVTGNQWMCGMPEELVLVTIDDSHVLMAFGIGDAINPFKTHLAEAYPEATIVTEALAG